MLGCLGWRRRAGTLLLAFEHCQGAAQLTRKRLPTMHFPRRSTLALTLRSFLPDGRSGDCSPAGTTSGCRRRRASRRRQARQRRATCRLGRPLPADAGAGAEPGGSSLSSRALTLAGAVSSRHPCTFQPRCCISRPAPQPCLVCDWSAQPADRCRPQQNLLCSPAWPVDRGLPSRTVSASRLACFPAWSAD